jgi:hypothetical protein
MILSSSNIYCQTSPLCPKYDSIRKAWAFVDCKTQKQVFAAEYRPNSSFGMVFMGYTSTGEEEQEESDAQPYFWSKFNSDSLKILDSVGNQLMAISKQGLSPLLEYVKVISPELVAISWKDTLVKQRWNSKERSMLITTQGKIWKPKNMLDSIVSYADTIGENYVVDLEYVEKDSLISYGRMLVDKQCNPLSKVYESMHDLTWNQIKLIAVNENKTDKRGYIDYKGTIIIPPIYDNNYYGGFKNNFIVLKLNNKFGVLDVLGKPILPFKYHTIRQINDDFFVVQDYDSLCNEYVVNSKQELLTKAIFCQIDSFANGKVWQKWGNKHRLVYNTIGKCLSSQREQKQKGLFTWFLRDTKTKAIYSGYFRMALTTDEVEILLVSPNQYQYKVLEGTAYLMRRLRQKFTDKIDFTTNRLVKGWRVILELDKVLMINAETQKKTILEQKNLLNGIWSGEFYNE